MKHKVKPSYRKPDLCEELRVRLLVWDGMCRLHRGQSNKLLTQRPDIRVQSIPVIRHNQPCNSGGDHIRNDGVIFASIRVAYVSVFLVSFLAYREDACRMFDV
jgi:hypothetical protein